MNITGKLPLALAHRPYRCVRPDILERDDPIGVVLVDLGEQVEHRWSGDQHVLRQRIGHVAQGLHHIGLRRRHLHKGIRRQLVVDAPRRERRGAKPLPARQIELGPLCLRQRPVGAGSPFVGAHDPVAHGRLVHDTGVDVFEPIVVPAQNFAVQGVEGALQMRRTDEQ